MRSTYSLALVGLVFLGSSLVHPLDSRPAPKPAAAPPEEHTLLFVGDVMLSRGVGNKMETKKDWKYPFEQIADTLRAADLRFANLECPVSDKGHNLHHLYSFRADPRAIEGLKYAGFDVVSVANNHIDDWGQSALLDSLRRLREAGIEPVGAGANDLEAHRPLVVTVPRPAPQPSPVRDEGDAAVGPTGAGTAELLNDVGPLRIAFLAYVNVDPKNATAGPLKPGVAWLDPERVVADIRLARPLADLVIVSLHWGNEYQPQPTRQQIELAHQMIDAGADLVVGSHPHVVEPLEAYRGRWVAYSLGNFVFDQKPPETHRGLMLKVRIVGKAIAEVTPIPITIDKTFQASLTSADLLAESAPPTLKQPAPLLRDKNHVALGKVGALASSSLRR